MPRPKAKEIARAVTRPAVLTAKQKRVGAHLSVNCSRLGCKTKIPASARAAGSDRCRQHPKRQTRRDLKAEDFRLLELL